jgi:hypothetical protein
LIGGANQSSFGRFSDCSAPHWNSDFAESDLNERRQLPILPRPSALLEDGLLGIIECDSVDALWKIVDSARKAV